MMITGPSIYGLAGPGSLTAMSLLHVSTVRLMSRMRADELLHLAILEELSARTL